MKLLVRLFPRTWQERYREEISDHLAQSTRPVRDGLDLLMALGPMWADDTRRFPMPTTLIWTRTTAAVLAVPVAVWGAIAQGPQHWWSTPALLLPLAAAAVIWRLGERTARHS